MKNREVKVKREDILEFALLVVRAFEVVEVLEGDLLEDGVDGLRVEALIDTDLKRSVRILRYGHSDAVILCFTPQL